MTPMVDSNYGSCGCGRSPTGVCCGWHGLTEEQYQEKLLEYRQSSAKNDDSNEKSFYLWLDNPDDRIK
jgi:hypothetical protein